MLSIDPALQTAIQNYVSQRYPKGLDPVLVGFVLLGTVLAAYLFEALFWRTNPRPQRRVGAIAGLCCSAAFSTVLMYMSCWSLKAGAIIYGCRNCGLGREFFDATRRYHSAGDHYVSLAVDPTAFWSVYAVLTLSTILMLSWLIVCIKSLLRWGNLS